MQRIIFLLGIILALTNYNVSGEKYDLPGSDTLIKISTNYGDILIKLYKDTPYHRENFIKLTRDGFFNQQMFHRVINQFMIQGGDPHSVNAAKGQRLGTGGPGYTIPAEFRENHYHKKGVIASARQGDNVNPEKASSGSQFYIVQGKVFTIDELMLMEQRGIHRPFTKEEIEAYTKVGGTPHLDGSYTVFGEVVDGMEVIDKIAASPTDPYDRPVEDIVYTISLVLK
ncbi:MAG: peptidylprolyl isomerase [Bacteroidota bacterium]